MPISDLTPQSRLHGRSIFLSASVPAHERADEYARIPEAPLRIEEAVIAVARAVFVEGGTLVFGGHPSISPLVARVVDHYYIPPPAENAVRREGAEWQNPSVEIYQSRVWQPYWAEATERLTDRPLVNVEWTDQVQGEAVDPEVKDRPQAPASMRKMRTAMIEATAPVAMVAIGGMRGVLDEAELFAELRPGQPVFALATTGGAAALLSERPRLRQRVQVIDGRAQELVRKFWIGQENRAAQFGEEGGREHYVPYSVVAQQIVAALVENL